MIRAYSYLRFSTKRQKLDSLERQKKSLEDSREWCEKNNIPLDNTLSIVDMAVSGYRGKNSAEGNLGQFLQAIEAGKVEPGSFLIVEELSRLTRQSVFKASELFLSIINRGVSIVSIVDKKVFSATGDAASQMTDLIVSIMLLARANNESANKSKYGKKYGEKARKGARDGKIIGHYTIPAWLEKIKDESGAVVSFRVIEERASIVRRIFTLARDGNGPQTIVKTLKKEGIHLWTKNKNLIRMVEKILRQRTVLGEYAPAMRGENEEYIPVGDPIKGYYPAIIDEKIFEEVQALIERRKKQCGIPERVNNLFSQSYRCHKCGEIIRVSKGGGKKYLYARCHRRDEGSCDAEPTRYDLFERALFYHISGLNTASILTGSATDKAQEISLAIDALTATRATLEKKIQSLMDLIIEAKTEGDTGGRKRWTAALALAEVQASEQDTKISALKRNLSDVQHTDTTQELRNAQDLIEYLQTAPQDDAYWAAKRRLKQAISALVEIVICYPNKTLYAHKGGKTLCFFIRFHTGVEYAVAADLDNPRYAVRMETEQPQTDEERKLLMGVMKIFDPRDLYKDLYGGPDTAPKEILSVQKADFQRYILDYLGVPQPAK